MSVKYSIIVPAYNVEKYIEKCLDSLIKQTYKDIEIIIIDDGSTDSTLCISKEYEKKYENVKVYHQVNKGLVVTRRNGIMMASGKYCMTVDSDDWVELDAVETLNDYIDEFGDVDVIKFRFVSEPANKQSLKYRPDGRILNASELAQLRRELLLTNKYNKIWNQVFKKRLYDKIRIDDISGINYGEDLAVNLDLIGRAKNVIFINNVLYHYYKNPDSITRKFAFDDMSKNISDNIQVNKKRIKYLKIYGISDVSISDIKCRSVSFACRQIKRYILTTKSPNYYLLKDSIDKTELMNFVSQTEMEEASFIDRKIMSSLIDERYDILRLLKPYLRLVSYGKAIYSKIRRILK